MHRKTYESLSHPDADFVVIDRARGYQAFEFMRNDPDFKNRPLMLFLAHLTDEQLARLTRDYKTVIISRAEFRKLGIQTLN